MQASLRGEGSCNSTKASSLPACQPASPAWGCDAISRHGGTCLASIRSSLVASNNTSDKATSRNAAEGRIRARLPLETFPHWRHGRMGSSLASHNSNRAAGGLFSMDNHKPPPSIYLPCMPFSFISTPGDLRAAKPGVDLFSVPLALLPCLLSPPCVCTAAGAHPVSDIVVNHLAEGDGLCRAAPTNHTTAVSPTPFTRQSAAV